MTVAGLLLGLLLFVLVLGVTVLLAGRQQRLTAIGFYVAGFFAALGKIWIFQQTPQWHDISPDSITYDLNAQGFALHWDGDVVDAYEYCGDWSLGTKRVCIRRYGNLTIF